MISIHVSAEASEDVRKKRVTMKGFIALNAAFFQEGVVAGGPFGGATDDEVVDEVDAHRLGGFVEVFCEDFVGNAGGGVAGGMVVGDGEVWGLVDEDGAEDFGYRGDGLVGGAAGEFALADELPVAVHREDDELFGREVGKLGGEEVVDGIAGIDDGGRGSIASGAGPEFEGCLNLAGFGEAEAVFLAELLDIESGEGDDAAVFAEEVAADFDRAGSWCPGAEKDREEFFVRESASTERGHFFPRFLVRGKIVDALVLGHWKESSIFRRDVASFCRGGANDCCF